MQYYETPRSLIPVFDFNIIMISKVNMTLLLLLFKKLIWLNLTLDVEDRNEHNSFKPNLTHFDFYAL